MLSSAYRHLVIRPFEAGIKQRKVFRYWRDLEESQWLGQTELDRAQFQSLGRLVAHAARNCPYYREAWQQLGIGPDTLRSPDDWARWPIIGRETITANRLGMRAPGRHLISKSTGGSSGVPLTFDLDFDSNDWRTAASHRGYGWAGGRRVREQLYFWGVPLTRYTRWRRWKDRCYNSFYRRRVINSFDITDERTEEIASVFNRRRPHAVVAYTGPLYVFAKALADRGLTPFSPHSIVVGAEKLHEFQRELIERVFRAPVFETYGSREFMLIGAECDKHEGLHLTTENLLVEVLDDAGRPAPQGVEGNVVITDLHNYGMPFIRYANGDRAVAGNDRCTCGRGLPLLRKVVGRRLDVLQTVDGRRIPGEFFPHLVKDYSAIRQFQVVQDRIDRVELKLVVTSAWREADRHALTSAVGRVLGHATRAELTIVDSIPLTRAGKHQVVLNRVTNAVN